MFISDGLSKKTTITFGEIEMGSTAIEIDDRATTLNLYCSPKQAKELAQQLLESISKYEEKYPHRFK
jgi:hypothetical protein